MSEGGRDQPGAYQSEQGASSRCSHGVVFIYKLPSRHISHCLVATYQEERESLVEVLNVHLCC